MREYVGKKVVVRADMAGVFFGTLKCIDGHDVVLTDARNIFEWEGAGNLVDIALRGIDKKCSKVTDVLSEVWIADVCETVPLTDEAVSNLEGQPVWTC